MNNKELLAQTEKELAEALKEKNRLEIELAKLELKRTLRDAVKKTCEKNRVSHKAWLAIEAELR